jgi:hypothetical protein
MGNLGMGIPIHYLLLKKKKEIKNSASGTYFYMFYIIRPQNYKYTCATKLHNTFYRNAYVHYFRVANVGSPDPMSM